MRSTKHPLDTIALAVESKPGHVWTYQELQEATGLPNAVVGSAAYKLVTRGPRKDEFERVGDGQIRYRSTEYNVADWTDVRTMRRAYVLYDLFVQSTDEQGRLRKQPEKLVESAGLRGEFRSLGRYSVMAVRDAARWLNDIGATKQNGPRVRFLVKHPRDITGVDLPGFDYTNPAPKPVPVPQTVRDARKAARVPSDTGSLVEFAKQLASLADDLVDRVTVLQNEHDELLARHGEVRELLSTTETQLATIRNMKVGDLVVNVHTRK